LRLTHASTHLRWSLLGLLLAGIFAGVAAVRAATDVDPDVANSMPEDYFPTLKTFIDQALLQSPQVIYQELNTEVAEAQKLYTGVAPLLPNLHGSAYGGETVQSTQGANAQVTRGTGVYYDLQVNQPVFQWGALKNGLLAQKIAVAIAQRNYVTVYLQYVEQIRKQFLGLVAAKIAVRNARFNLDLRKQALDAAQQQLKAGVVTDAYVMGPQLDLEDAQLSFESNLHSYNYGRRQLAREIGQTDIADDLIPREIPAPTFSLAAASDLTADVLRTGARYTPDAQVALLNIRNWQLQYQINKVNLLPKISGQVDFNQSNTPQIANGQITQNITVNQTYYLQANWNIFDGFATRGRKQEALIRRRQAERDLKAKTEATEDAAQNSERMVELAWKQLDLTTRRNGIAHASLKQAEDDLAAHVGSEQAVAGLRANAYNFEYSLALTRTGFLSQWSDFVSLVGHDPAMNNLPVRYVRPVQ
jgi:outer membrane protein TolC